MRRRLLGHVHKKVGPVESYIYDNLVISSFTYDTASATGENSLSPALAYSYEQWRCEDGVKVEKVADISNGSQDDVASVVFSIANKRSDVTLDTSTGVISCNASDNYNAGTYDELGDVTVKVTVPNTDVDDLSAEATWEVQQAANSDDPIVSTEYSTPEVILIYDTAKATDTELNYTTFTYEQTRTDTHASGAVEATTIKTLGSGDSAVFSLSNGVTGVSINSSTGKLTFNENTVEEQITLGTVSVTVTMNSKSGTAQCVVYQEAGEVKTNLMDVVFYNKENGKLCIMNRLKEDYTNYPKDTYTPIGIVIAECDNEIETYGQNGYNAGKGDGYAPQTIGIMALNNAVKDTVMWGGVAAQYWLIPDTTDNTVDRIYTIPLIGETSDSEYNGDWATDFLERGNPTIIGMPSDLFNSIQSADEDAYYKDGYDMYTLSPYTSGLFHYNTKYWEECYENTGDDFPYYNCFSDFSGEEKSQVYLHRMTDVENDDIIEKLDRKWMDSDEIDTNKYMLPAMEACYKYSTDGTGQGTWYLPAAGELGHIVARTSAIDETLDELASTYGVSVTKLSSVLSIPYLASTIGFFTNLNGHVVVYPDSGGISLQWNEDAEIGMGYVRPFKRMDVYYKDSEGYFHDGDRTENEWYDQIPTAYKDEYAQHIGIYRNSSAAGSSNYPSGNISGVLYGVLVKGEEDFTVMRTDVPLFEISSLATGETIVKTFDQNPQCGWYVPQYIGVNDATGITFLQANSAQIESDGEIKDTYWRGTVSVWNRCDGDAEDVGSNYGNDTTGMKAFRAGDWNFNIAIVFHASNN